MLVTITRTSQRSYAVRVAPVGHPALEMNPAPSYDERLPHDVVHFVVENELRLARGIFGQLAAGGRAGTFRPVPTAESSRGSPWSCAGRARGAARREVGVERPRTQR